MAHDVVRDDVPLAIVGVDFRIASAQWRNVLLLEEAERARLSEALTGACQADGLVVLETCNRVEWVTAAPNPLWAADILRAQVVARWRDGDGIDAGPLPQPASWTGLDAVRHLQRVAVGLESFVQGEREIAGQLQRALTTARQSGRSASVLNALQTAVGRTVRKVQRLTLWRHAARGVHGLAVDALDSAVAAHPGRVRHVAVVGMGEIGRKTAGLLAIRAGWKVHRFNRTPREGSGWLGLDSLHDTLARCDAVVVATGARTPVVDLRGRLRSRTHPLVAVDLGAPAQLASGPRDPVRVLRLDDLLRTPAAMPAAEERAAVEALIEDGVAEFLVEHRKRELAGVLRAIHDTHAHTAHERLPAVLAEALPDLTPERRRRLELAVAELLRDHARTLVREVEAAACRSSA
ncbi:MAG: hypothetical protein EXR79_05765 [Myxococcales bacterium]|nr:hypothetical protein [Myxococcales bacterium]